MAKKKEPASDETTRFELACGQAIRSWAHLERTLWLHLFIMLGIEDQFRVRIIWASLPNYQARRKLLNRLAETYLDGIALPKFRRLVSRMSRLAHKRNLIAHAFGGMWDRGEVTFISEFDDDDLGFNFLGVEKFHITNVANWSSDIDRLTFDFMHFYGDFAAAVHRAPRMHREQQDGRGPSTDRHQEESTPSEPQRPDEPPHG